MDKVEWLERNGYLPLTDAILREWLKFAYEWGPEWKANELFSSYAEKFTHYKRFGKQIVTYSPASLERSIQELKRGSRRMFRQFVICEMWPIKQIHRTYTRWKFGYYKANGKS